MAYFFSFTCFFSTEGLFLQKQFSARMERKKKISIKDIAKEAGVSPALVSFVLNGKQKQYRVSDAMADKINEVARRMDYKPNGFAKSLRDGTSHTIGVIVSDIANPFSANMVKNIETTAEEYGYMALFASSDEKSSKLADLTKKMLRKEVDGIILVPCEGSDATIQMLSRKGIPLVLLDRYIPGVRSNYVCLNNKKAAIDATEHLLKKGYRKICMIGYDLDLSNMKDRIAGYKEAMTEAGLKSEIHVKQVSMEYLDKSCEKAVNSIRETEADAIIFATNSIAVQSLKHIHKNHIRIPDDMGVICFDGGSEFDFFYAPLTYISQPIERMARKAVEILIEQIESYDGITQQVEAEGTLILQASTR